MALVCISLIAEDVEHFVLCLSVICISSLVKCLFTSFAHFLITYFFKLFSFQSSLDILDTNPLSFIWFANISSISLFVLLMESSTEQKFLIFEVQVIDYFSFWIMLLVLRLHKPSSQRVFLVFYSKSCVVLCFTLKFAMFLKTAFLKYNSHAIKSIYLKCTIQWFLVYSQSCATSLQSNFKTFSILKVELL